MKQGSQSAEWDKILERVLEVNLSAPFENLEQETSAYTNLIGPIVHSAIIEITGKDRISFLHALVTGNIENLQEAGAMLTAWCSPKGRVIALLRVLLANDRLLLLVPNDQKTNLLQKLRLYILRAEVELRDVSLEQSPFKIISEDAPQADPSLSIFSEGNEHWVCGPVDSVRKNFQETKYRIVDPQNILLYDLERKIPKISSILSETFLPQELGLETLNGLSFDKGCYPGQEIIARVRYRGKVKKTPTLVDYDSPLVPPEGTPINVKATGKTVGTVLYGIPGNPENGKTKLLTVMNNSFLDEKPELQIGLSVAKVTN